MSSDITFKVSWALEMKYNLERIKYDIIIHTVHKSCNNRKGTLNLIGPKHLTNPLKETRLLSKLQKQVSTKQINNKPLRVTSTHLLAYTGTVGNSTLPKTAST